MTGVIERLARWMGGLIGAAVFTAIVAALKLDWNLAIGLGVCVLAILLVIAEKPSRPLKIGAAVIALAAVFGGLWMQSSPSQKIGFSLKIERVDSDRVYASLLVENKFDDDLTIVDSILRVGDWYVDNSSEGRRVVPAGQATQFSVDQPNGLALKGGIIGLDFSYSVGGSAPVPTSASVAFRVPINPTVGVVVRPFKCCSSTGKDLWAEQVAGAEGILDQPNHHIIFPALPEIDQDGNPLVLWVIRAKRRLSISVPNRVVAFGIRQNGAWRDLTLPLATTLNGEHYIEARWNESKDLAVLIVDAKAMACDTRPRCAYLPAEDVLKHEN